MSLFEAILRPLPIYTRVYENKFVLKVIGSTGAAITIAPPKPFSSQRLLIGNFTAATAALTDGVKQSSAGRRWFAFAQMVIHPKEKIEGGLSEVEERLFREIALQARSMKAVVWTGADLSDDEVLRKLR